MICTLYRISSISKLYLRYRRCKAQLNKNKLYMDMLMRNALASSKPGKVCFYYIPKARINPGILIARFGDLETEIDGDVMIHSLDKKKLQPCFYKPTIGLPTIFWQLSICGNKDIFSVGKYYARPCDCNLRPRARGIDGRVDACALI